MAGPPKAPDRGASEPLDGAQAERTRADRGNGDGNGEGATVVELRPSQRAQPALGAVPRLARGVRLRVDRLTGKVLLLRPEQGFELVGAAVDIVRLCDGELTVRGIIDRLARDYSAQDPTAHALIAGDVLRLLASLSARGLIELGLP